MSETPISRNEASRLDQAIRDLTAEMKHTRTEFTTSVDALRHSMDQTYVRKDVIEPRLIAMERDTQENAAWITWAQRIVLSLVITAVVGTVLIQGGLLHT